MDSNPNGLGQRDQGTRIERILGEVLRQPTPEARQRSLAEACGDDAKLRAEVESLLAAHTEAGDFLEHTLVTEEVESIAEGPGTVIGHYKLLEQIGEGGFGVVYMAEQIEPVQRKVALKIVKAGMDTREVIARFEAERQALALMDHPNIARVLDAGATDTGRPYFVMELVQGIAITRFCDEMRLSTADRLGLFIKVCQAVQHAHQKGIIHRDLKPSNVLVTLHDGAPVPKVIDFGVAKALGQKLTDKTLFTGFLRMVGTPAYMSPEQADLGGLDIDTRSDIYSLGVLLYELLTGVTPFDAEMLRQAALDEVRRMIRETEPPRPSTRLRALGDKLTEVARRRQMEAPRLIHFVRGDLDWIVMKCLEKDRRRRYDTANMVAMDLQRHLDNEPIVARPPSAGYRLQKLVRRNKLVFATGGAVAVALIVGLGVATVALFREQAARERAMAAEQEQSRLLEETEEARRHGERLLYAADMKSAFQAIESCELGEAHRRLTNQSSTVGQRDLRGWEWRYLWQLCQGQELVVLGKHEGTAEALAFSPAGQLLASGGSGGLVKIWDVSSNHAVTCLTNEGDILALAFSPDGNRLAVGTSSGIRLWITRTWRESEAIVITNGVRVESLCFTPNGARLVAANTCDIGVWQAQERPEELDPLQRPIEYSPGQHAFALVSNGGRVVHANRPTRVGSANVILQDFETGSSRPIWASKHHNVRTLAVSPNDQWLALALNVGPVEVLDLHEPEEGLGTNPAASCVLDTTGVFALAFSPDGKLLAVGGRNGRLELWETATWRKLQTGLGNLLSITDIAFSPDTNLPLLATSSADGTVRLWSAARWEKADVLAWPGDNLTEFLDPNWRTAMYVDRERGTYALWDLATGSIIAEHVVPYPAREVGWANIGPGGKLMACSLKDRSLRLWEVGANAGQGEERWRIPTQAAVSMLHFSPEGKLLFGLGGGGMWVWDVRAGREIGSAKNSWCYFIYRPQFTASQHQLAIPYGSKGKICLWDFAGSGEITLFEGCHPDCLDLAISPDGRTIATVNRGGTLKLWDVTTRKEINEIVGRGLGLFVVAFSPDSQRVISGSTDELKVWDIQTRREVGDLSAGADNPEVYSLLFQDPNTLLVAGANGIRRLHAPSFAEIEAAEKGRKIGDDGSKIGKGEE